MTLKTRITKVESRADDPICPLCGADRRDRHERMRAFLRDEISRLKADFDMESHSLALEWIKENCPGVRADLERDPSLGPDALALCGGD